jgi:hypothetical protein
MTIGGIQITDIRGFFEYDFVLSVSNYILMRLKKKISDRSQSIIMKHILRNNLPQPVERLYKKKLPLKFGIANDIFNLATKYITTLSESVKSYWYPKPTADNTISFEEKNTTESIVNWIMEYCESEKEQQQLLILLKSLETDIDSGNVQISPCC